MDIILVSMPYADLPRPPAAMGLIHAILENQGLDIQSIYANLSFADICTPDEWNSVSKARNQDGLADWTFSRAAFPGQADNLEKFLDLLKKKAWVYNGDYLERIRKVLRQLQSKADAFCEEFSQKIISKNPKIVACSSTFSQHVPSLALLRHIKKIRPDIITMMGGANCEGIMGHATHRFFPWMDYVVSGEADIIIGDLVKDIMGAFHGNLQKKSIPQGVLAPVHRKTGYPKEETWKGCRPVHNLDTLPLPQYSDYFSTLKRCSKIKHRIESSLPLEASRGCWWEQRGGGCTFCGLNGGEGLFRSKSGEKVLEQVTKLNKIYGTNRLEFTDNILNEKYFKTVLQQLKENKAGCKLFWETKSNLNASQLKLLRQAGVSWIQPGIESLHTDHLKLMNKGCEAWQHIQFLKYSRQYGLRLIWFILNGLPGEKSEWFGEMARIIPLLTHLQPMGLMIPIVFTRFSKYHTDQAQYGLKLHIPSTLNCVYPLSDQQLSELTYFFEDEEFTAYQKTAELLDTASGKNGKARFRYEIALWMKAFRKKTPPVLIRTDIDNGIILKDTRKIAVAEEHHLQDIKADIYKIADTAPLLKDLPELLHEKYGYHKNIKLQALEVVHCLVKNKVMLILDNRVISLALQDPIAEMPGEADYPCGKVKW